MGSDEEVAAETDQEGATVTGGLLTRGEKEVPGEPTRLGATIAKALEEREAQAVAESGMTDRITRGAGAGTITESPEGYEVATGVPGETVIAPVSIADHVRGAGEVDTGRGRPASARKKLRSWKEKWRSNHTSTGKRPRLSISD